MIENNIFDSLKPTDYTQAETQIETGDIMLCSGDGFISSAIKDATSSIFSHVAMILRLPISNQWLILESVESYGVRCVTLENGYVNDYMDTEKGYTGKILIARHSEMKAKAEQFSKLYHQAFSLTGDKYNKEDIFKIGSRIALNKIGIHESGELKDGERYICSEYVYACLKTVGISLPFDKLGFIAPADIARAPNVEPVLQLAVNEAVSTKAAAMEA